MYLQEDNGLPFQRLPSILKGVRKMGVIKSTCPGGRTAKTLRDQFSQMETKLRPTSCVAAQWKGERDGPITQMINSSIASCSAQTKEKENVWAKWKSGR